MKISHDSLAGTWMLAGSEIDGLGPGDESYRFLPPDVFEMKFRGNARVRRFRYRLTDEGFIWGNEEALRCPVTAWLEVGFLVFRPPHGMESWSARVGEPECLAGEVSGG